MYVVMGATGNIGRVITETLLSKGKSVKAISRDAERLRPLVEKGTIPCVGQSENSDFLLDTFQGTTTAYTMIHPILHADNLREYQNKISENIARAIENSEIKYVVNLSSLGAHLSEGTGILLGSHDHEQRLNKIDDINIIHLRPAYFMENFLGSIGRIKREGIFGSSLRGDISMPLVATRDIAEVASQFLLNLNFSGITILDLLGERNLTMTEVTRILGEAIGKPDLSYSQFPYNKVKESMVNRGISLSMAEASIELSKKVNENPDIFDSERTTENTTSTSIEDFAKIFAEIYQKT